jgi:hypothetical protein
MYGWGVITDVLPDNDHGIYCSFDNGDYDSFMVDGKNDLDGLRILFFEEIVPQESALIRNKITEEMIRMFRVGDRVWSEYYGYGFVVDVNDDKTVLDVGVKFDLKHIKLWDGDDGTRWYNACGINLDGQAIVHVGSAEICNLWDLDELTNDRGLKIATDLFDGNLYVRGAFGIVFSCAIDNCDRDYVIQVLNSMGFNFHIKKFRSTQEVMDEINSMDGLEFVNGKKNWYVSTEYSDLGEKSWFAFFSTCIDRVGIKYMSEEQAKGYIEELKGGSYE